MERPSSQGGGSSQHHSPRVGIPARDTPLCCSELFPTSGPWHLLLLHAPYSPALPVAGFHTNTCSELSPRLVLDVAPLPGYPLKPHLAYVHQINYPQYLTILSVCLCLSSLPHCGAHKKKERKKKREGEREGGREGEGKAQDRRACTD